MTDSGITWPAKRREMYNHHMDSTRWNGFPFRDDDIVVASYAKSGTTWTQQIVCELIFQGADGVSGHTLSPWIEMRLMPWPETLHETEAQAHRRCLKTHLPVDALTFSPRARYLYIARDPRDIVWSLHNHHCGFKPELYEVLNNLPGRVGDPLPPPEPDIRAYYHAWLDGDGAPFWSFWENMQSWWDVRSLPNVKLLHYNDLKANMAGEIRAIADFLDIDVPAEAWPKILEHCSFDWMKRHASETVPFAEMVFKGGADTFINKGENGRWRDVLTPAEAAKAEEVARANLSSDCARWVFEGGPA